MSRVMLMVYAPWRRKLIVEGEFVFDMYTLGPGVLTQLWDYTRKKVEI